MIILHTLKTGLTISRSKQKSVLSNCIFNRRDPILKLFFCNSFVIMHRKSIFAKKIISNNLNSVNKYSGLKTSGSNTSE
ncbi:MAG: hypothetical protein DWI06_02790 [Planctomycetota bacterium]|nr:MAG: hypothetical protein DWI06_02790 [Planctomycetota bacterium]